MQLELDHKATGQVLESLAQRLLGLEKLREHEVGEDAFADAKNDALALRPLYEDLRGRALQVFGLSILDFAAIQQLDALYRDK